MFVAIWLWKLDLIDVSIEWHLGTPEIIPPQWGQGTTSFTTLAAELCCNNVRGAAMDAKPLRGCGVWDLKFFFVVKKCLFNLDLRILGGWKSDPNIFSQVRFCSKWWFSSHGRIESIIIHHQRKRSKLEAGFSVNACHLGFGSFIFGCHLKPHKVRKRETF